jgi:hypothetical protein
MTLIVTWLWQGLAIAWITAASVRAMPRLNAATRHAVWWLALAGLGLSPSVFLCRCSLQFQVLPVSAKRKQNIEPRAFR